MTPLMTSNVLSIGPPEGGVADDDGGLKAGVAPGNEETTTGSYSGQVDRLHVTRLTCSMLQHTHILHTNVLYIY